VPPVPGRLDLKGVCGLRVGGLRVGGGQVERG
jgi:hypothetical protein